MSWLQKIIRKLTAAIRWGRKVEDRIVAEETRRILSELIVEGEKSEIFKFVFGLASKEHDELVPLRHGPVLWRIIDVTARQLVAIQERWLDASNADI